MNAVPNKFHRRILSIRSVVIPQILGEPALVAMSIVGDEGAENLFDYQIILKTPDALHCLNGDTADFNTAARPDPAPDYVPLPDQAATPPMAN